MWSRIYLQFHKTLEHLCCLVLLVVLLICFFGLLVFSCFYIYHGLISLYLSPFSWNEPWQLIIQVHCKGVEINIDRNWSYFANHIYCDMFKNIQVHQAFFLSYRLCKMTHFVKIIQDKTLLRDYKLHLMLEL